MRLRVDGGGRSRARGRGGQAAGDVGVALGAVEVGRDAVVVRSGGREDLDRERFESGPESGPEAREEPAARRCARDARRGVGGYTDDPRTLGDIAPRVVAAGSEEDERPRLGGRAVRDREGARRTARSRARSRASPSCRGGVGMGRVVLACCGCEGRDASPSAQSDSGPVDGCSRCLDRCHGWNSLLSRRTPCASVLGRLSLRRIVETVGAGPWHAFPPRHRSAGVGSEAGGRRNAPIGPGVRVKVARSGAPVLRRVVFLRVVRRAAGGLQPAPAVREKPRSSRQSPTLRCNLRGTLGFRGRGAPRMVG